MWRSKAAALAATGFPENSFWWQVPHLACCAARSGGIRLMAPHDGQTT
jgi:hypothetical protein